MDTTTTIPPRRIRSRILSHNDARRYPLRLVRSARSWTIRLQSASSRHSTFRTHCPEAVIQILPKRVRFCATDWGLSRMYDV